MTIDPIENCLAALAHGRGKLEDGDVGTAETAFRIAEQWASDVPPKLSAIYKILMQCHLSLLERRCRQTKLAKRLQQSAVERLDLHNWYAEGLKLQEAMAAVLMKLGEYRRALPFCEEAIRLTLTVGNTLALAPQLMLVGRCYNSMGLREFAVNPARLGLKIFRDSLSDPRLPGALITLGNAIIHSDPIEAERLYREAAQFEEEKGHHSSSTSAWTNLGIICARQGRFTEAMEFHRKAVRIREQNPKAKGSGIGSLLNNLADCHRRMGNFEEALMCVDHAIEVIKLDELDGIPTLANAYGTRGLILRDQHHDAEAVHWLQRSYMERSTTPSPNFEYLVNDLQDEIAALSRLGRLEDVTRAEERLAKAIWARSAIVPLDCELSFAIPEARGSLLIEINNPNQRGWLANKPDFRKLGLKLLEIAKNQKVDCDCKRISKTESTSLILESEDAEALFQALLPTLSVERACAGAVVTIRQGQAARQLTMPNERS
jgi:tetratricopeptide (TPR) repeat protein